MHCQRHNGLRLLSPKLNFISLIESLVTTSITVSAGIHSTKKDNNSELVTRGGWLAVLDYQIFTETTNIILEAFTYFFRMS